MKTGLKDFVIA